MGKLLHMPRRLTGASLPPLTLDDVANDAWAGYEVEQKKYARLFQSPDTDGRDLRAQLEVAIEAEKRWKRAYTALCEPTPHGERDSSARLTCEGFVLMSVAGGFVGLFLPDLLDDGWPLAITFIATAAIGVWSALFLGRLGRHIGRRL